MRTIARLLATGFGLGYAPIASGTVGTLPGLFIAYWLAPLSSLPWGWFWQAVVCLALIALSIAVCEEAERQFGTKDDGRIVADEYLTFPITLIGLPFTPATVCLAFFTARVFDIIKPPPARQLQELHGGLGITIDDVFSSLYSLAVNHLVYRWVVVPWLTS